MSNPADMKDRGNIKWTAMILPEHRAALHEWERSQSDIEPPSHDEDVLADIAEKLARAIIEGQSVTLRYWKNKREYEVSGVVKRIDPIMRAVLIDGTWIPAVHIIAVD